RDTDARWLAHSRGGRLRARARPRVERASGVDPTRARWHGRAALTRTALQHLASIVGQVDHRDGMDVPVLLVDDTHVVDRNALVFVLSATLVYVSADHQT